jgi:hypothetical protein
MPVRPGGRTVAAAGLALTLALVAAAFAWSQPRRGIDEHTGLGLSAAGALRIADSRDEAAILEAPALAPGGSAVGQVTIHNLGVDGRLVMSRPRLVEAPGAGGAALAPVLRLRIRNLAGDRGELVYAGALAAMPTLQLGPLPAGESRRYRFAARLPEPGLVDNGLMGARVRFDYRWRLRRR